VRKSAGGGDHCAGSVVEVGGAAPQPQRFHAQLARPSHPVVLAAAAGGGGRRLPRPEGGPHGEDALHAGADGGGEGKEEGVEGWGRGGTGGEEVGRLAGEAEGRARRVGEVAGGGGLLLLDGGEQRGQTELVGRAGVRAAGFDEQAHKEELPCGGGEMERSAAAQIDGVRIAPGCEEALCAQGSRSSGPVTFAGSLKTIIT
jgi:hypothetical protein